MQNQPLIPHPTNPPRRVQSVGFDWQLLEDETLVLVWRIEGATEVVLPGARPGGRADDLWRTTCFELFLGAADDRYCEFNFSPSGEWAAYEFESYRNRLGDLEVAKPPRIELDRKEGAISATVRLSAQALDATLGAGPCAVIEEAGGHFSYWAMAHGAAKPDFHHPACLALHIAPPNRA